MSRAFCKRVSLLLAVLLTGAVLFPAATLAQSARAQEARQQAAERRENGQQNAEQNRARGNSEGDKAKKERQPKAHGNERRKNGEMRLEAARLRVCESREKAILSIMARIADRGAKQLDVFTKIAERVQAFYIEQGNPLSSYDTLVANLNLKRVAAQNAVEFVRSESDDFKCSGSSPLEEADTFKESRLTMNSALKEYKTAVRDLIVGVKSVQGGDTEGSEGRSE